MHIPIGFLLSDLSLDSYLGKTMEINDDMPRPHLLLLCRAATSALVAEVLVELSAELII